MKGIKIALKNITEMGVNSNIICWNFIKPFLRNKVFVRCKHFKSRKNNVSNNATLANEIKNHYINSLEKTSRIKPTNGTLKYNL